jgi:hypothetical protein
MAKREKFKPSTGKNRPPRNSLDASWLPIIEDVHRQLPQMRAWFAARRNRNMKRGGPRKKRH